MPTTSQIRSEFLNYFSNKGHTCVNSSPLVPNNDPSLLFINAGMVQFKNIFTGSERCEYNKAVSVQKCVRAGGKHNDLDNVGHTARHHTLFEMLGNFSFGDYFKEKAIMYAWDLLTNVYGLPKDRLLVTVYHDDDEAASLWKRITNLPDDKIIRIATSDNFWSMGNTGPCGPCSEVFYDHGEHIAGGIPGSPDEDGDRFTEIWNLVFMQFEKHKNKDITKLQKPSIDTGMGLERISSILQGKHDNYDIDLFRNLIESSAHLSNTEPDRDLKVSHRVIADHIRSIGFLIADGVLPLNEGRGYVLRRIMRRAMRHAHMVGVREPFLYKLIPSLIQEMGEHYQELIRAQSLITETLKLEENRFLYTLERGLKILDDEIKSHIRHTSGNKVLPGHVAFKLYDTYGFPLDLTTDILKNHDINLDIHGFNEAMDEQKQAGRKKWVGSGDNSIDSVWFKIHETNGDTDFLGYSEHTSTSTVTSLVLDNALIDQANIGQTVYFTTDKTPFYGESGGQVGDIGYVTSQDGLSVKVHNTLKVLGKLHVHEGEVMAGVLQQGQSVTMHIDLEYRHALKCNHSATHLLHKALFEHLGNHISQKGSLVAADRLRFDISHHQQMTLDEIKHIEFIVNQKILNNDEVTTQLMKRDEAIASGAAALFGEKYSENVRVVSMGTHQNQARYSVELCGGTHVTRTGEIGCFKIISESAIATGVRRIEALTGLKALSYLNQRETLLLKAAHSLKTTVENVPNRLEALLEEKRNTEKELSQAQKKLALGTNPNKWEPQTCGAIPFISKVFHNIKSKELRTIIDEAKKSLSSGIVALIAINNDKAAIAIGVTSDLTDTFSAVDLARLAAQEMDGKGGGGRADFAQAGGANIDKAQDALDVISQTLTAYEKSA